MSHAAALSILLAAFVACEEPEAAVWDGELLTVTSSDGVALCGGTLDFLDRFVGHAYEYWTGEVPPDGFALELDLRASNGSARRGSANADDGFAWISDQRILVHELTHIVVGHDDGASAPSLGEGIAEAFGPADPVALWGPVYVEPTDYAFLPQEDFLYADGELSGRYYAPSAQLVAFLIERYGVATVRAGFRQAGPNDTAEEIEDAFVMAFGDGLYDAFDEFVDAPQCALQAWECSDSVLPARELPIAIERIPDCTEDPSVLGAIVPGNDFWFPMHQFVVDLAEETVLVVDTTDNAFVQRVACVDVCDVAPWNPITGHSGSVEDALWGPGRSFVTVWPIDPTRPFSATIEPR